MAYTKTNEQFIIESFDKWNNTILPIEIYKNSYTKINFKCNKCGNIFSQMPCEHLRGYGCPKCKSTKQTLTQDEFKEKSAQKWDGRVIPLHPYINSRTKILFRCNMCKNEWMQKPADHLVGYGCPKCNPGKSKMEDIIKKYLIINNINFIQHKWFDSCRNIRPLPFDFYFPEIPMLLEYDGRQHFMPRLNTKKCIIEFDNLKKRDSIKTKWCQENNIKLIRISYLEKHRFEEILSKELNIK